MWINMWTGRGIDISPEQVGHSPRESTRTVCDWCYQHNSPKSAFTSPAHHSWRQHLANTDRGKISERTIRCCSSAKWPTSHGSAWARNMVSKNSKIVLIKELNFLQLHATTCLLFGIHGAEEGIRGQRLDLLFQIEWWKLSRHCPKLHAIDHCFLR